MGKSSEFFHPTFQLNRPVCLGYIKLLDFVSMTSPTKNVTVWTMILLMSGAELTVN